MKDLSEMLRKGTHNHNRRRFVVAYSVFALLMGAAVVGLIISVRLAKSAARESACTGHVFKITLALTEYRRVHGGFPEPVMHNSSGELAHSWRVVILPQLGYDELYRQYDFEKPWNGPHNLKVMSQMPTVYTCPNCSSKECTSYFMRVGKEMPVIVVEMNHQSIPWTEPRDLMGRQPADAACDPHGFAFGLSDGRVGRGDKIPEVQ
jgi:hypothetical protein